MSLNELKIGVRTLHSIGKHVAKSGFEHLFYLADGVQGTSGRAMLYIQVPHDIHAKLFQKILPNFSTVSRFFI